MHRQNLILEFYQKLGSYKKSFFAGNVEAHKKDNLKWGKALIKMLLL
jgi:hypothetical protein